jgi:hypothetical protein
LKGDHHASQTRMHTGQPANLANTYQVPSNSCYHRCRSPQVAVVLRSEFSAAGTGQKSSEAAQASRTRGYDLTVQPHIGLSGVLRSLNRPRPIHQVAPHVMGRQSAAEDAEQLYIGTKPPHNPCRHSRAWDYRDGVWSSSQGVLLRAGGGRGAPMTKADAHDDEQSARVAPDTLPRDMQRGTQTSSSQP